MDAEIGDEFHYILQCQSLENEIYILVLQCINGVSSNPVEERTKI